MLLHGISVITLICLVISSVIFGVLVGESPMQQKEAQNALHLMMIMLFVQILLMGFL